jgi:ABC-type molybdate transport system permease subunit
MKTRLKVALSAAVILISLGILSRFLAWMNRPSDIWLYAGAFGALLLLVLVPTVVGAIWRSDILKHKRS